MKIFSTIFFMLLAGVSVGQSNSSCAFGTVQQQRRIADANYTTGSANVETAIRKYLDANRSARVRATVYTLPVVFHVIHSGGSVGSADNPSDAAIQSTLALLNTAWRKNGVAYGGVDMEIQFALAKRSPDCVGAPGINRVNGNGTSDYATNGITTSGSNNQALVKGLSRWSSADYINIWIVTKIDGGNTAPGGFAYFPEHADSKIDGITILANTVDGVNKTIVHEMGHVFGLYHTFRVTDFDETSCPPTTDCANTGDMICDTEPSKNVTCSVASNSCTGAAFVVADVSHGYTVKNNYMSYSTCQQMFTQGQKDRVRAFLALFRPGLISSLALTDASSGASAGPAVSANALSQYSGVERVKFSTIDIYSGTSLQDNANFVSRTCNQRTTVLKGNTYSFTATGTYGNPHHFRVYIDYNNNGNFKKPDNSDDPAELVLSGFWAGSVTGDIVIPNDAELGAPLLMRVVADALFETPPTATQINGGGQAEDFSVTITPPLPVTFSAFSLECQDKSTRVLWSTSSEINADHFEIQRSRNGISWALAGLLDAAGESTVNKDYTFVDFSNPNSEPYYRIAEFDIDGTSEFTRIQYKSCAADNREMVIWPNPVRNKLTIGVSGEKTQTLSGVIYNVDGNAGTPVSLTAESADIFSTAVESLQSGFYILTIGGGSGRKSFKFLKE